MARVMVVTKYSLSEVKRLLHPRAIIPVRVGQRMIADEVIRNTLGFVLFYVYIFVGVSVALTAMGFDVVSALRATAASIVLHASRKVGDLYRYCLIQSIILETIEVKKYQPY